MTHRADQDAALVERYLTGDTAAFDELMRAHQDRVFGVCLRMLRDRDAALDATQETFITVFRKADRFAGRSAFSTWLYRVAVNTCYDAARKSKRRPTQPLPEGSDPADERAGDDLAAVELRPDLEAALASLPEEFRSAVVLSDLQGLALQTVADILEVPVGTVKSRVFRGRKLLAGILGAALTEGILAEELASAAEAQINACPECSADLAAQRLALNALRESPPAAMTPSEAANLRDAVAGAIGLAGVAVPRAATRSRRSPWPAIAIAAGLAGIITIVPVMGLINSASDDTATTESVATAFEEFDDQAAIGRDSLAEAPTDDAEMLVTAPAESIAEAGEAPATTTAAATTEAALNTDEEPAGEGFATDGQDAIRELFEAGPTESYAATTEQTNRTSLACSAEAEQHFGNQFLFVNASARLDDGRSVVLYAAADWSELVAFDLADCSAVLALP